MGDGKKYDEGKLQWHLIRPCWGLVEDTVKVLMFGAEKYGKYNWMEVRPLTRYHDAIQRHISKYSMEGEWLDKDTGLPHLAHIVTNCLFLWFFDKERCNEKNDNAGTIYRVSRDSDASE